MQSKVISLFDDYTTIVSKAKNQAKHGKGLKMLTPKQMLQNFPIGLAKLKPGIIPEN